MPYINETQRDRLHPINCCGGDPKIAGELNYTISVIIDRYLKEKGLSYLYINEVIGVLECAKLELYRRIAAPYEDKKKEENGDVYTFKG